MGRASHIPLSGGVAGSRVRVARRGVFPSHSAQLQSLPLCGGSGGSGGWPESGGARVFVSGRLAAG